MPAIADLDALRRAGVTLAALADLVTDETVDRPTPCTEWSVGDLVDHVVGGNVFTVEILSGATADAAMGTVMAGFGDADYDRRHSLIETTRRQEEAFAAGGVLEGRHHHIEGDLLGVDVLRARLHDLIIHGWDLAQSLEPPARVPVDQVEWAAAELSRTGSLTASHFAIDAAFVVDSTSLLRAFGREV